MQPSRPQVDPRAIDPRVPLRPISLIMLNLLILLVAIGAFNCALSLVNLTNHFTHAGIEHTPAAMKALLISVSSFLMAVVSAIVINRAIVRLRSMASVSN
jgi:drug/metabolite transporter (DMT)-like permease